MIKNFLTGSARFRIQSNDFRLLNRLRIYKLSDVVISDKTLEFTVPLKNMNAVKNLLPKSEVKINKNIFGLMDVFYMRPALSISAVVCLIMFIVFGNFVFRIKVIGVEGSQQHEIARFIQIKPLSLKSNLQARITAESIVKNFDYVAHASSKIVGSTLYFLVYTVPLPGDKNNNSDIIAAHSGVITKVVVASGRALVSAGDIVRQGDVLIKGEYQIGELEFARCRAVGEVMADVSYSEFGMNTTAEALLAKIIARTGIQNFDRIETFTPLKGVTEVVATINRSIT